ncbi:MAG: SpoIIE family protein phosphatase, partial [Chloroflexales bacterium]|nr:SpoIIE family protein phosphatase [Chloroflexales bacterium]
MTITWGAACRPKQGQSVSGDIYVLEQYGEGQVLAAVIDGLGGGVEAHHAAQLAADLLRRTPHYPLPELIRSAHTALHSSRGAVAGLLHLDTRAHQAWYIGVGNIGIHAFSTQQIKPISKNGILGARLPTLLELHYTYNPGDTFVLYSDGISTRWSLDAKLDLRAAP